MKYFVRIKESRSARNARPAVAALAVAAAFAGVVAGQASASPAVKAGKVSYRHAKDTLNAPKLAEGVLTVTGTKAADTIALRLQAGQPSTLQVDFDNGSAVFSFPIADVTKIDVKARRRRRHRSHRREQRRLHRHHPDDNRRRSRRRHAHRRHREPRR